MHGTDNVFDTDLRFDEIAVCAELFAAEALIFTAERGHHDNLDVFCLGRTTQNIKHIKPANLWHHHVTNDELRTLFDRHCKRFFPVSSRNNIVTFGKEAYSVDFSQAFVVFN
jgi:hypothetical protein